MRRSPVFLLTLPVSLSCALLLAGCSATGDGTAASDDSGLTDRCDQLPTGQVSLPADDGVHDESVEWWYWTGHLTDDQGSRYGFEQAMFVFQIGAYLATSAHVAVTDIDRGSFVYDIAYVHGEVPEAVPDGFSLTAQSDSAVGGSGQDHIIGVVPAEEDGTETRFDLDLVDAKAPVFHHGDGYQDYDAGGYTWYYSRPRMTVSGTLTIGGQTRPVTGSGWFDHQWGDLLAATDAGWDWFALQLDDGRELMLFMVKGSNQLVGGSLTDAGCNTTDLQDSDIDVEVLAEWTSPTTGCTYPQGWSIRVGEETFVVDAVLPDQELVNDYETYWEGACTVSGDGSGRAYVELAGQCG